MKANSALIPVRMAHHFTVDVEEYFHPTPLLPWVPVSDWDCMGRRSPELVDRILSWLAEHEAQATFFVLGWLAERERDMVRTLAANGHEVASHGWSHRLVTSMDPKEFREDVRRTKALLEDLTSAPVTGYRAPSFSIVPGHEWALEILAEEGHLYDSSLFPVGVHPTYGYPCDRDPHCRATGSGTLVEIPPSTLRLLRTNLPAAGGAYLRFFPYNLIHSAFQSAARRDAPGTFYVHPWEIDADPPELGLPPLLRTRVRGRLGDVPGRIRRLLRDFRFRRMDVTARELHPDWTD